MCDEELDVSSGQGTLVSSPRIRENGDVLGALHVIPCGRGCWMDGLDLTPP